MTKNGSLVEVIKNILIIQPLGDITPQGVVSPCFLEIQIMQNYFNETIEASKRVVGFMPFCQLTTVMDTITGEIGDAEDCEKLDYLRLLNEMGNIIEQMPLSTTQGNGGDSIVHLHYYCGGNDWWITQKDIAGPQLQAFGVVSLSSNYPEFGYISIETLRMQPYVELDFNWVPKKLNEIEQIKHLFKS